MLKLGISNNIISSVSSLIFVFLINIILVISANIPEEFETCTSRPNIIFITADDAGWNDFSFHGSPQIPTPNIDALALTGVILNNYYASPLCTPTRGSIQTGKHPIHIRLQHYVITGGQIGGLPLEEKLLPQFLKELDYSTHLVGKWHLGNSKKVYTPTYRGFDTHYGNWLGLHDYYDHYYVEKIGSGYDFRRGMEIDLPAFGEYTTDLYTNEAVRIIDNHPDGKPLFLMLNHIAPHSANEYEPLQAPQENVNKFKDTISDINRRKYAGMVDKLDESIGNIVEALERNSLLENTIIIFTSDNGGSPEGFGLNYGSNWPLRGVKNSLWEGGTRVAGFIWSPLLLPNHVSMNLMHVQDWLPTIYEGIGGNITKLGDIDGVSQWKVLQEPNSSSPARMEFLYNIDDIYNSSAVRMGPWKAIKGNVSNMDLGATHHWDSWYGPSGRDENITVHDLIPEIVSSKSGQALRKSGFNLNTTNMHGIQEESMVKCEHDNAQIPCDSYTTPCLFNIIQDPCEYYNLAEQEPEVLSLLLELIAEYNKTAVHPLSRFKYPQAAPKNWGYVWTNWNDFVEVKH